MQNAKVDRNLLVWLVATFFLATVSLAEAQQAKKVARIGYLGNEKSTASEEAFLQGLREREWIEGQNIVVERRYWENRAERLAASPTSWFVSRWTSSLRPPELQR